MKIHKQITPDNWCKNHLYEEDENHKVIRRCALGWIVKVYDYTNGYYKAYDKLSSYLSKLTGNPLVEQWNDAEETKFEDVKIAFVAIDI